MIWDWAIRNQQMSLPPTSQWSAGVTQSQLLRIQSEIELDSELGNQRAIAGLQISASGHRLQIVRHWPGKDFLSLMVSGDTSPSEASNMGSQERSLLVRMGHQLSHLKPAVQSERNSGSRPESSKHLGDPNQASLEGFAVYVFFSSVNLCHFTLAFLPLGSVRKEMSFFRLVPRAGGWHPTPEMP